MTNCAKCSALHIRIGTEVQACQIRHAISGILPRADAALRELRIKEIVILGDIGISERGQMPCGDVTVKPSAHPLFGTRCFVELRALSFDPQTPETKTFAQLIVFDPEKERLAVRELTLGWYLVAYAAALKCQGFDSAQLDTRGLSTLKCTSTDVEDNLIEFGDDFGRPGLTEKLAHQLKDVIRFVNKGFVLRGLPSLIKGGIDGGYWFDTHPANVRITPAPSFAFAGDITSRSSRQIVEPLPTQPTRTTGKVMNETVRNRGKCKRQGGAK